jgi:outer membrane protein OmpA-like peptidoglycan-associated protein
LSKRSEPLYWLNPLDGTFNDISELKQRPVLDLTDTDGDGVIDMMDLEPNSPVGSIVDHRGLTMDSDKDGIPDHQDIEPFSPPGLQVDEAGKATIIKECCITREEVEAMLRERGIPDSTGVPGITTGYKYKGIGDWFLPMIHFDLDKYQIKPAYFGHLKHVAEVMEKYPDLCVTAYGHTDYRNSNDYNNRLAYERAKEAIDFLVRNYGIPRERFKLMYGGEDMPLIKVEEGNALTGKDLEMKNYMNRRVEFRTCKDTDKEMEEPQIVKKWTRSQNSPRSKQAPKGDKNSGF